MLFFEQYVLLIMRSYILGILLLQELELPKERKYCYVSWYCAVLD